MRERTDLEDRLGSLKRFERELDDAVTLVELGEMEDDSATEQEGLQMLRGLVAEAKRREIESLLSGEADSFDTYIEVHSGAGGTESCDWARMLSRMYGRWAERRKFTVELLEETPGDEAGIKSATLMIKGHNAHGWAKTESGVHRLVRISPFDSNARRHTSFASVWVYPVVDDTIHVDINESDCRIDTYRASGSGGQHVNKTDSAIRITHLPSGIVVECQDERSQHKNRARAMALLLAKLKAAAEAERHQLETDTRRSLVGSGDRSEKIRTYNYPDGRLTDHRIKLTLYKLGDIMAGNMDDVIQPLLAEHQADQLAELAD